MHYNMHYNAVNAGNHEYDQIWGRDVSRLGYLFDDYAKAYHQGNSPQARAIEKQIAILLSQSAALAYMLGKRRTLLEYDYLRQAKLRYAAFIDPIGDIPNKPLTIPKVKFSEAIEDMVSKEPRLVGSVEEMTKLYSQGKGFAMLRSMNQTITKNVHRVLAQAITEGSPYPKTVDVIAAISGQDQAYAATVYRTNIAHSYTAGRFKQAADPDVSDIIAGMRVITVRDSDVRPNHAAYHGFTARVDDPIWSDAAPPLGFSCRCRARVVTTFQLEREGMIDEGEKLPNQTLPAGAHRDEGFTGRHPLIDAQ